MVLFPELFAPNSKVIGLNSIFCSSPNPLKFLKNKELEVVVKGSKDVVGTLNVNAAKMVIQNVAYMSENERFRIAKCIGMSRLDALANKFNVPPTTSPQRASVIWIQNAIFQL